MVELYYRGSRIRKGSGVSEEVRRTPEQPLVQAAASVSGAAQDGGSARADTRTPQALKQMSVPFLPSFQFSSNFKGSTIMVKNAEKAFTLYNLYNTIKGNQIDWKRTEKTAAEQRLVRGARPRQSPRHEKRRPYGGHTDTRQQRSPCRASKRNSETYRSETTAIKET